MKEALARALSGNVGLGESPSHDAAPVDRLHAIAAAQRVETFKDCRDPRGRSLLSQLGRDVISFVDGNGPRWRCEIRLANILMWREYRLGLMPHTALTVARQALREAKDDKCRVCNGRVDSNGVYSVPDVDRMAGRTDPEGPIPMTACPSCGGTGKHKWEDKEREEEIGGAAKFSRAMMYAHGLIAQARSEVMIPYSHLFKD